MPDYLGHYSFNYLWFCLTHNLSSELRNHTNAVILGGFLCGCVYSAVCIHNYVQMHMCVCLPCGGPDAVSCGPDEETGLHGCPSELHLSSQPCTPAGKPEVRHNSERVCACVYVHLCVSAYVGW